MDFEHKSVLLREVVDLLQPRKYEKYVDFTVGGAGHAAEIGKMTDDEIVIVDRDKNALDIASERLEKQKIKFVAMQNSFANAAKEMRDESADLILLDLGVSSPQLDKSERGFSFQKDAPLDMRMDESQSLTAAEIVNEWPEKKIAEIIFEFGEDRASRKIASKIVATRPHKTTVGLADVVRSVTGDPRIDPATRTFQALRMVVNDEMGQLERVLPECFRILRVGGRLAVISFHSLEDRAVKNYFKSLKGGQKDGEVLPKLAEVLVKKPICAGKIELNANKRCRSAKLRGIKKLKNKNN